MPSTVLAQRHRSDSDVSDSHNGPAGGSSSPPSPNQPDELANHDQQDDHAMSESEESADGDASGDADFDMDESLPSQHDDAEAEPERASSVDSNHAVTKRKAPVEEDEFIKANPELYGLRRSVGLSLSLLPLCDTPSN